jgi:DNA-binding Lrp family transcriptional regulator
MKPLPFQDKVMQHHQRRAASRNGTNLEHAHLLNQRVILETIRLRGPVSRVEIARITSLTNQTVFNIVDGLQRAGLIQKFGLKAAQRGQPAKVFEINPDGAFSIGLHLERDHIAAVLVDFSGVVRTRTFRAHYLSTPDEARKQALSSIRELQRRNGRRRIWGLGIALPGPVDSRIGKVISMPNFPGWEEFNVRDYFNKKVGLRVLVDNDATAAAIGESWYGVGRMLSSFFYIYMGIGVGGGIIVDGRPFRGFRGNAGNLRRACRRASWQQPLV